MRARSTGGARSRALATRTPGSRSSVSPPPRTAPENRPTPAERDECLPFTRRELALLPNLRVILCLGAFAWDAALRLQPREPRPRPKFSHGGEWGEQGVALLASFHCSQQNTFTGRLTEPMFDAVLVRARELAAARTPWATPRRGGQAG